MEVISSKFDILSCVMFIIKQFRKSFDRWLQGRYIKGQIKKLRITQEAWMPMYMYYEVEKNIYIRHIKTFVTGTILPTKNT